MLNITLDIIPTSRVDFGQEGTEKVFIRHHSTEALGYPISINLSLNRVLLNSDSYFNEAMLLAQAYEDETGEEFTIKKEYVD